MFLPVQLYRRSMFLEFLAEAIYFSVDPYQRMKLGNVYPCDMIGGQIARSVCKKEN